MTPRATRVLSLSVLGALTLAASAAWACDATKSANATACAPKAATAVTAAKSAPAKPARIASSTKKSVPATARKSAPVTATKKGAPIEAGMRAYIDPETGTFTSLPEVSAIGTDGIPGDVAVVLVETPLPGRGYTIDLQGTLQDYSILHIDAKGNRHQSCTKDPRTALKCVHAPVTPAFPEK